MLKKNDVLNYFLMMFTLFISFSVIVLFEDPIYHIVAIWITVIVASIVTKFDIVHPLFWFSVSFVLYSSAYTILFILGYSLTGYNRLNILLPLLGLTVFYLTLGIKNHSNSVFFNRESIHHLYTKQANKKSIEFNLTLLLLLLTVCTIALFFTPFNSKTELTESRNLFYLLGAYGTRFITFFISLYLLLFINDYKKRINFFIIASAVLVVSFSLFTGERDAMFRFFVVLVMTLFILKKIGWKTIFLSMPIAMTFLIFSRYYKYYFVRGEIKETVGEESLLYSFLMTDFHAAGENLQILLNNPWTESIHGYSLILVDFLSPFIPGGIFLNVGVWFNEVFYSNSYSRAFSLVGQGYVIGGFLGVIVVFFVLGIFIKFLYSMINKNVYWLAIYIYSIPVVMSSFRSTLSSVFTGVTRIVLVSLFLYVVVIIVLEKNKTGKNEKK